MTVPKLTESSEAVVLFRKKLRNGDIPLFDNAKSVRESNPTFMRHELDNFHTNVNRFKVEGEQAEGEVVFYERSYPSFQILFLNQNNCFFRGLD